MLGGISRHIILFFEVVFLKRHVIPIATHTNKDHGTTHENIIGYK